MEQKINYKTIIAKFALQKQKLQIQVDCKRKKITFNRQKTCCVAANGQRCTHKTGKHWQSDRDIVTCIIIYTISSK